MPLPLAHAIVGYATTAATGVRFRRDTKIALLFSVVVANLPDLDFLPGALAGEPALYHRTVAHSLLAAALAGLVIGAVVTRFSRRFGQIALLGFLVYASHLFADTVDLGGGGRGVQLLWPLSQHWFEVEPPLGARVQSWMVFERGTDSRGFFASLFSLASLRALLCQAVLYLPVLIPALWWRRRRSRLL